MLRGALQDRAEDHDQGPRHDRPASAVAVGKPGDDRDTEDGAELVAGAHETEQARLNGEYPFVIRLDILLIANK